MLEVVFYLCSDGVCNVGPSLSKLLSLLPLSILYREIEHAQYTGFSPKTKKPSQW